MLRRPRTRCDDSGAVGLDMDDVGLPLKTAGVASFHKSFREVLAALDATARQPTRH